MSIKQTTDGLLGIEAVAWQLGVSVGRFDRWLRLGWVDCNEYEEVGVPGVGWVSARRWLTVEVSQIEARLPSILLLEQDLRKAMLQARLFGNSIGRLRFGYPAPIQLIERNPVPPHLEVLTDNSQGYRVGVKQAITAMFRTQHVLSCSYLSNRLGLDVDLARLCLLKLKWRRPTSRESYSPFLNAIFQSNGGIRGGRPVYEIYVHPSVHEGLRVSQLLSTLRDFREYDFISDDPEIGRLKQVSIADALAALQLHEIAHAAAGYVTKHGLSIPVDLIREEKVLRTDQSAVGDHDVVWSSIYRLLRRKTKLIMT